MNETQAIERMRQVIRPSVVNIRPWPLKIHPYWKTLFARHVELKVQTRPIAAYSVDTSSSMDCANTMLRESPARNGGIC
jgi:hypothetical protein